MSKRELAYVVFDRDKVRFWYFSQNGNHWEAEDADLSSQRVARFCLDRLGKPNQVVYAPDGRMYVYPLPDNCKGYICVATRSGTVIPYTLEAGTVLVPVRDGE